MHVPLLKTCSCQTRAQGVTVLIFNVNARLQFYFNYVRYLLHGLTGSSEAWLIPSQDLDVLFLWCIRMLQMMDTCWLVLYVVEAMSIRRSLLIQLLWYNTFQSKSFWVGPSVVNQHKFYVSNIYVTACVMTGG